MWLAPACSCISLAPKSKSNLSSQVNNADDEQESGRWRENRAEVTTNQASSTQCYSLYYPFEANGTCRYCHEMLGTSATNLEAHLKSHGIQQYEYQCGTCKKSWPSWRSVITHYNRSKCRQTTPITIIADDAKDSEVSSNIVVRKTETKTQNHGRKTKKKSEIVDNPSVDSVNAEKTANSSGSVVSKDTEHDDDRLQTTSTIDSITTTDARVNSEETGRIKTTAEKKLFYCKLCATKGWDTPASLSQHMRHMHLSEYNAIIAVPMVKRRWTKDETLVLAELEASISSSDGVYINQVLTQRFPSRTFDAIKSHRKRQEYRALVEQIRNRRAASSNLEGSNCTFNNTSSSEDNDPVVNDSNCFDEDDQRIDPRDTQSTRAPTTTATTTTVNVDDCPNIRQYIREHIIDGKIQLCDTMNRAVMHYVNNVPNADPVNEALRGIQETLASVHPPGGDQGGKPNAGSKLRSQRSKRKAQKFAHYQRLYKSDKSKLASEIFDHVDTSAIKPPLSEAHEHFRKIWETKAQDTGAVEHSETVGVDILLAPITREEIAWAIDQTRNDTAVGPDHVSLDQIRVIAKKELWCAFNIWLGQRKIPDLLKINRTALLPKGNEGLENIKNWRPITIASLLIRLYNKILTRRMQSVFHINRKQTGFKPMNGVGQNTSLLHNLLRHARTKRNSIFVCLLDVSKAFDSVPHDSIKRALRRNGCPTDLIDLISDQYENIYTRISYGKESSQEIFLNRGVKQGDPMSSILFNLVIDELFEIIGDRFGYEIDSVGSVNARAFADDIALISGSEIGMQQLLATTEKFLLARGLELNVKKCVAICLRKAGKAKKSQIADSSVSNPPRFVVNNGPIRLLGVNDQCKYLGIQYTPLGAVDSRVSVSKIKLALESLSKAPLKPQQKVLMLRSYLIPRFIHTFTHTECYPKLMGQQDRLIRRWLKQTLRLPMSISSDFFYLPIKEGGLGIGKLYDIIGAAKVRLHGTFGKSGDACLQYLVETQGSAMHARWCQSMKISYRPSTVDLTSRKNLVLHECRERFGKTVHGGGSEVFRSSPITYQWLSGQTKILKGSTYIRSIQMRTNTIPTRVTTSRGQDTIKTCRRCGLADETLIHILQTCPITQGMRCQRHNNVCRKVAEKLRSKGFQVFSEQGIPSPGLETNISRPDLIAKRDDEALVLDVTCVYETGDHSLHDAYRRKVTRYESLAETIKQHYQVQKVTFHGLCIGSRGAYDTRHLSIWHSLGFSGSELMVLAVSVMEDSLRTITLFNNANSLRI